MLPWNILRDQTELLSFEAISCGCLYSYLSYLACKLHFSAPCYIVTCGRLFSIFPHYFINATIFGKKSYCTYKLWFNFSLQLLSKIFPILRRIQQDVIPSVCRSSYKVPVIFVRFLWHFNYLNRFRKNPLITFIKWFVEWKPSCSLCTDGRTGRHEANSSFSQFCESA